MLGMGRFPDSLFASTNKVNDAMHRFKKCAPFLKIFASVIFILFYIELLVDAIHFYCLESEQ